MAVCELGPERVHVLQQHGRQVRVRHRAVAARDQSDDRRHHVRGDDLLEARGEREFDRAPLVDGVADGVQQRDGHGTQAFPSCSSQVAGQRRLVERLEHGPVGRDSLLRLDGSRVEHCRQADVPGEDVRTVLVPDAQHVAQPAGGHEQRGFATAFEQCVGRDRRAQPHRLDRRAARGVPCQQLLDAPHGGIARVCGIAREHLVRVDRARRVGRDDVGEGAAAVDGETPAAARQRSAHEGNVARRPCDENCGAFPAGARRYDARGTRKGNS